MARQTLLRAAFGVVVAIVLRPALAQDEEEAVVVSATRSERRALDLPVSIGVVSGEALREGQPQINLSESLPRVPGLVILNRQNYAQDLQLSIRGFGARSTFGIRGVKLYTDGIPATMPDGQGQAANFDLSSAQRIEVMRGPVASLYGNSSGGVIQLFTADGPPRPTVSGDVLAGSYGTQRIGLQAGGRSGALNAIADWWRFRTDGYREHSAAHREQFNSKLSGSVDDDSRVSLVLNVFNQPFTQDPLGLSRAQAANDPRQADPAAAKFNTGKRVGQEQAGLIFERRLGAGNLLRFSGYFGDRQVKQLLALTGSAITSSGGVVDLDRDYGGFALHWIRDASWLGRPFSTTVGYEHEQMHERRRGFVNNFGAIGDLRRDEDDRVESDNLFAQADWKFHPRASMTVGVRSTRVAFDSRDHFIVPGNPDDSGAVTFANTSPVAGITYRLAPEVAVYASAGRGFETPTFAELAYRNGGSGLNFALRPARSATVELGVKGRIGDQRFALARFDTTTRDEIVVDTSTGGRTTFKNAARTARSGWELSWLALLPAGFDLQLAWTLLEARYSESFASAGPPAVAVPAGNRIPGIPRASLFGELRWTHFASGFVAALEARHNGKIYVDDANSDAADAYTVFNLRAGFEQSAGSWRLSETLRVDNFTDRNYVGSVIVADSNGRFFEPAPRRNFTLLFALRRAF